MNKGFTGKMTVVVSNLKGNFSKGNFRDPLKAFLAVLEKKKQKGGPASPPTLY